MWCLVAAPVNVGCAGAVVALVGALLLVTVAVAVNVVLPSTVVVVVCGLSVGVVDGGDEVDWVGVEVVEDGVDVEVVVGPLLTASWRESNDEQFATPGPLGSDVVKPPTTVPSMMP